MIGLGTIIKNGSSISYQGTLPQTEEGERVCVIRESDLALLMKAEEKALLKLPYEMERGLYGNRLIETRRGIVSIPPKIVDELVYNAPDGTNHKLFLDHHLYSSNPRDMLWCRWVSVDQSFFEEGTNPNGR